MVDDFDSFGHTVVRDLLSRKRQLAIGTRLSRLHFDGVGTRSLLSHGWCRSLARRLARNQLLRTLLPSDAVAVQCTYFPKDATNNWSVALHRDVTIPVLERFQGEGWSGWSTKEGMTFAQAPMEVLQTLVAVRLHFEASSFDNGPLEVVSGSHRVTNERCPTRATTCVVPGGGALVLRPLLLHSSPELRRGRRRVLHFVYGPRHLPQPAQWAAAV